MSKEEMLKSVGNGNRPSMLCIEDPVQPGQNELNEEYTQRHKFIHDLECTVLMCAVAFDIYHLQHIDMT